VGGAYGNKNASIKRFIKNFQILPEIIKRRLVIENDHQRFHLKDCLKISEKISIPILFDYFHHKIYNSKDEFHQQFADYVNSWGEIDGIPLCDYSSQQQNRTIGSHAYTIDLEDFRYFLELIKPYDIDIMLEIKDKEKSAIKAIKIAKNDKRFFAGELIGFD
jgi:UV DNA damage endonuclease